MPNEHPKEGGNVTQLPALPLCLLHTPPCLLVSLDPPSLLITAIN